MPQNITDVNTFTDPIVSPSEGDPATAASVLLGLQGLSNRTRASRYKSGTFVPTVTGTAGAFNNTPVPPTGKYERVGNLVFMQLEVNSQVNGSTGGISIGNIPYAPANSGAVGTVKIPGYVFPVLAGHLNTGFAEWDGVSKFTVKVAKADGSGTGEVIGTAFPTSGTMNMQFYFCYITAAAF